jgi:hypothetical protein
VARHLGLTEKPLDPGGTGWWLSALVRRADERVREWEAHHGVRLPATLAAALAE